MILKKIVAHNFGPFPGKFEIDFEDDVTVLTGANDTGKSALLRLVRYVCDPELRKSINNVDYNLDRMRTRKGAWKDDAEFCCQATFALTPISKRHKAFHAHREIIEKVASVVCGIAFGGEGSSAKKAKLVLSAGGTVDFPHELTCYPTVISLPPEARLGATIPLNEPNATQSALLRAAFGQGFSFDKVKAWTPESLSGEVDHANEVLKERLGDLLPPSLPLRLKLTALAGEVSELGLHVADDLGGHSPLRVRGSGVNVLAEILATIAGEERRGKHILLLFDEPEDSLHADAQHELRAFLERLTADHTLQVVYATHSPSMVNTQRPQSIRVLRRTKVGPHAGTLIEKRPQQGNYLPVRASLGLSAGDSLLYSRVTIVVEGDTEVYCLPQLLQKLCGAGGKVIEGFGSVPGLLADCHFLDGMGDNLARLARLAESQGTRAIIFVDGDKQLKRLEQQLGEGKRFPTARLPDGKEFEDFVPPAVYIETVDAYLAETGEHETGTLKLASFETWWASASLPDRMPFSKRVARWVQDTCEGREYPKAAVMRRAVDACPVEKIQQVETLRQLMRAMAEALK